MLNLKKNIFNRKNLNYQLARIVQSTIPDFQEKLEIIKSWTNYIQSGNIYTTKETALQGKFLDDIFSKVLGYRNRINYTEIWNLNQEQLTTIDSKFSDGSLGFFTKNSDDVRVVIELKDANTNLDEKQHRHNDTRTPIEQAFSYQHKIGKSCKWVLVSNYKEIRLYNRDSSTEYEVFTLTELGSWEQFRRFYYLLSYDNLIAKSGESLIDSLYAKNEVDEVNISKEFYLAFKQVRMKLFEHLKLNNPDKPGLLLLEKTQKFLDRFIFISFCEDNRLLPEKTFKNIIDTGKKSFSFSETKIWNELKGLFQAINVGSPPHNINKFNGGLFASDIELDELIIKDSILETVAKLTDYDFETDVDVNILGHIFEQSISDIEEIKSGIEGKEFDKKTSKRKKDGIFYTPEYITKYIVENAIGGWLNDRKKELGFYELPELTNEDIQNIKKIKGKFQLNEKLQKHLNFWLAYKVILMNIKVLDPACGSGAFLNQAFNFLYAEGQLVNDKITELSGGQSELFGLDKHILSDNLFGVDLNNESVEITKLSLWIKTANKDSELSALDNNIKCGNSLIDDPAVAGDKAFNWNEEFAEIMQRGGFDVIIGNPPWGAKLTKEIIEYITQSYIEMSSGEIDTYVVFILKAIKLLKLDGYLGFIVPDTWLSLQRTFNLRKYIYQNLKIIDIFDRYKPFEDAKDTRSHSIILNKKPCVEYDFNVKVSDSSFSIIKEYYLSSDILSNFKEWNLYKSDTENSIFQKMISNSKNLNELYFIKYGLRTGDNQKYLNENDINGLGLKIARGSHIQRYLFNWNKEYLVLKEGLPSSYFEPITLKEKIILQYVRTNSTDLKSRWLESTLIEESNYIPLNSTTFIYEKGIFKLKYLLTILSSYLLNYFYKAHYTDVNVKPIYLEKLPIPEIDNQEPFIILADTMLEKNKELQNLSNEFITFFKTKFGLDKISTKLQKWYELDYKEFLSELAKVKVKIALDEQLAWQPLFTKQKTLAMELKNKIDETDRHIDGMVYELYGLTEEEIKIVGGK